MVVEHARELGKRLDRFFNLIAAYLDSMFSPEIDFLPIGCLCRYFRSALPPNPSPSPARLQPADRGRHFLVAVILRVGVTLLGLGAIATICHFTVPPIPRDAQFESQTTVPDGFFYAGQPAKTMAYEIGCAALPFLLALGWWIARRCTRDLSAARLDLVIWTGLALYFLIVAASALPMFYCPHPVFPYVPPSFLLLPFNLPQPFVTPQWLLFVFAMIGAAVFFLTAPATRHNANRARLLLVALWALLIPSRFYAPVRIDNNMYYLYHLNSVLDALSQVVNGHHVLVDFPHIYGGYIEMLAPIIRLFPRELGTLLAVVAVPNVVATLCLLLTARLVVRRPGVLFLCGLSLLGIGYVASNADIDYGYLTARVFFPPMALLAATLYFRRRGAALYAVVTLLATLAPVWNLDSGLVLWGSWLATLILMAAAERKFVVMLRHAFMQVASFIAAWTAFFLYLRLASGRWPDPGMIFEFQKFVVSTGYFCLALLVPDVWIPLAMVYLIGLAVALHAGARRKVNRLTPVIVMLSLFGIGIFSYFMGRSAETNLIAVAYPATLLAGILCAESEVLIRARRLPVAAGYFLVPAKLALFWWSFLLAAGLTLLLGNSVNVIRDWSSTEQTPLMANAAFVSQQVKPHEANVFFLSNHSGIYFYLSDTTRTLPIPGNIELLRTPDMNELIEALRARRVEKLFLDRTFYGIEMYRPDVYQRVKDAIAANYQPITASPDDSLVLYEPK